MQVYNMIGAIPELAFQGDYEVDAVKASIQKLIADLHRAKRDKNYAERVKETVANSIGQGWLMMEKGLSRSADRGFGGVSESVPPSADSDSPPPGETS